MMAEPGEGRRVTGEVYEVEEQRLKLIDRLESLGQPGNFRMAVHLESIGAGDRCQALTYMKSRSLAVPVHTGFLDDYRHDPRFVPPKLRGWCAYVGRKFVRHAGETTRNRPRRKHLLTMALVLYAVGSACFLAGSLMQIFAGAE